MRLYCFALVIVLLVAPSAHSKELDFTTTTCSAFLELGQANYPEGARKTRLSWCIKSLLAVLLPAVMSAIEGQADNSCST
jgi:hypothetical protein